MKLKKLILVFVCANCTSGRAVAESQNFRINGFEFKVTSTDGPLPVSVLIPKIGRPIAKSFQVHIWTNEKDGYFLYESGAPNELIELPPAGTQRLKIVISDSESIVCRNDRAPFGLTFNKKGTIQMTQEKIRASVDSDLCKKGEAK